MKSNIYKVNKVKNYNLIVNGRGNDKVWNNSKLLTDFVSPWDIKLPNKIEFRALWDENNLYFSFKVYDDKIYINKEDNSIKSIGSSDRVELFFRTDSNINPYYCLEIDPSLRTMNFIAYPNRDFDFSWKWPSNDINIKSNIEVDYFVVEGSISISSMKVLNLIKDNKIETGIFRAKYNQSKNSEYKPTWITWINPQSKIPDFHIPSSFGTLVLIE